MTGHSDDRRWRVDVYHVIDQDRQQRILAAFRDLRCPDVTALGTQSGPDWFVAVETSSPDDRAMAHTTVTIIDRHAVRTYSYGASTVPGPMPA